MNPLEQRVAILEASMGVVQKSVNILHDSDTQDFGSYQLDDARFSALLSIVEELAERAGLPREEFRRHFATRQQWFHHQNLQTIEEKHPNLAGEIDTRPIGACEVEDTFPPLFDGKPPEHN